MKVVFLESVEGTAQVGEVKDVKDGFARNYLLPRGLAGPAIEPYLTRAQSRAKKEEKRQGELDRDATAIAERITGTRVQFPARVGEQGKLYGSITTIHIAEEVAKLINEESFDHRKVLLPEAIKEVGVQTVRLRLTRNVEATIEVEVYAEGEEPGMEPVTEEQVETAIDEAEALDEAVASDESEEVATEAEDAEES
jgi:large subunit ribosomal protein L9